MMLRKRRTREHVIADLSVNFIERQALLCGYSVERIRNDYGYDLFMFTYSDSGEVENGEIRIQVKATDALSTSNEWVLHRVQRSDLMLWLNETSPVILAIFDAKNEQAYWVHIQRYFAEIAEFNLFSIGKSITLRIPSNSILDPHAIRIMRDLRNDIPWILNHRATTSE